MDFQPRMKVRSVHRTTEWNNILKEISSSLLLFFREGRVHYVVWSYTIRLIIRLLVFCVRIYSKFSQTEGSLPINVESCKIDSKVVKILKN